MKCTKRIDKRERDPIDLFLGLRSRLPKIKDKDILKAIKKGRHGRIEMENTKLNWGEFDRGVFLVNLLAIIFKDGKILIGRRENDPYIKQLSWCFPGGRPAYEEDLEYYLKLEVKKKTGLEVQPEKIVFAKTYPENRQFLSIYYFCKVIGGVEKAGKKFKEIKWVKLEELKTHFTTSLHYRLYQMILEYSKS